MDTGSPHAATHTEAHATPAATVARHSNHPTLDPGNVRVAALQAAMRRTLIRPVMLDMWVPRLAHQGPSPRCVAPPTVRLLEVFRAEEGVDLIREAVKVAWRLAR